MIESKSSNRVGRLDVNISSDLPSSNMKTIDNLTRILRMSYKTLWTVFVKELDQFHDIDKKTTTYLFPAIVIMPTVLCRI